MIKKFGSLVAALVLACTQANAALLPTTATVNVDLADVLLLSDIAGGVGVGGAAFRAAFWNAQSPGSISSDGEALLAGLAGPGAWAVNTNGPNSDSAQFEVNSSAARTGFATVGGLPTIQSQDVFSVATPLPGVSIFSSGGPIVHNSESPGGLAGDFTAHGRAEISNVFSLNVLSDVSVEGNANSVSFASANSSNTTFRLDLASAAAIAAINGGSSTFTIRLYVDTILASIDLFTDGDGSSAEGEFSLNATLLGFSGAGNTGSINAFGGGVFGDTQSESNGGAITSITTGLGPSTSGGLAAIPFATLTVNAAITRSIRISLDLTSSASVTTPTPEPASMALLGLGFAGLGAAGLRRRNKATAA